MKRKILTSFLIAVLVIFNVSIAIAPSFALDPPTKPTAEELTDNKDISQYNEEVKEYNAQVDNYNEAADKEYEAAVQEVDKQNEAGLKIQEETQKAHDEATAANEAEQQRVDTENANIDKSNAAEAEEVKQHNSEEDAKVEQSKSDKEEAEKINADKKAQYDAEVAAAEQEYEEAVAAEQERITQVKAENKAIREHNEKENQKVAEAEAQNAENKANVEKENAQRQSKYDEDVKQYESDKEQYQKDYADYTSSANQTDIKNEQIILNAGYSSVAEYNMLPLKSGPTYDEETGTYTEHSERFENLLTKAVYRNGVHQENSALKEKEYTSTVNVQKAEEESGETYTLYLTHYLTTGQSYTETIVFDANDTVTIKSLAHANNSKPLYGDENYGAFYSYQGDRYLNYYWYQVYGQFEYPPLKNESDYQEIQDKGNSYVFSYKNGKKNYSDSNEIYVTYYYSPYLTCNIPLSEPIVPTEPILELLGFEPIIYTPTYLTELDETENVIEKRVVSKPEYVSVPTIYSPQYKTYVPIPHIKPQFINVPDVKAWTNLPKPDKIKHLNHLGLVSLLPVSVKEDNKITTTPNNIVVEKRTIIKNNAVPTTFKNDTTPIINTDNAIPTTNTDNTTSTIIEDKGSPKASPKGAWALINLIATIFAILIGLLDLFRKNEKEEKRHGRFWKAVGIILAVVMVIIFILTENIFLPMILVDKWTLLMIILLIIAIINIFIVKKKCEENEDEMKKNE